MKMVHGGASFIGGRLSGFYSCLGDALLNDRCNPPAGRRRISGAPVINTWVTHEWMVGDEWNAISASLHLRGASMDAGRTGHKYLGDT